MLLLAVIITMKSQFGEPRMICSCTWVVTFVPLAVIIVALLLSRVTLIVPACQRGWKEMENLRGNLRGNEFRVGGRATLNVTLSA